MIATAVTNEDKALLKRLNIIQGEFDISHGFNRLQKRAVEDFESPRMSHIKAELKGLESVLQDGQDVGAIQDKITDLKLRVAMEQATTTPKFAFRL